MAKILSQTMIDKHPVVAEYKEDVEKIPVSATKSEGKPLFPPDCKVSRQKQLLESKELFKYMMLIRDRFLPGP